MSLSQRMGRVSAHLSPVWNLGRAKRLGPGEAGGEPSSSQGKGPVCPFVGIRAGPPGRLSQAHRRPSQWLAPPWAAPDCSATGPHLYLSQPRFHPHLQRQVGIWPYFQ